MADNFTVLKQQLDSAINPNAAPGTILAQDHNDWDTAFLKAQGKYVGSPFKAKKEFNGVANAGELFFNGALNDTNGIQIVTSKTTSDLNDFKLILNTLSEGDLIHIKDYEGRSVFFKYVQYTESEDDNQNTIYLINVIPDAGNVNYTYQVNDEFICVLETIKGATSPINYLQGVELDLFWKGRGWSDEHLETEFYKFVERKKLIEKDTITNIISYKTIDTKVCLLGIRIKNFGAIANLFPQIVIERYKRPRGNSTAERGHKYPAGYRSTFRYNDQIKAEVIDNSNIIQKEPIDRPQVIDVQSEMAYYDIFAENYFSQIDPPKVLGNNNCLTHPKSAVLPLKDNSGTKTRNVPVRQKGKVHLRLRLRLTTPEKGLIESDVLAYFKIIDSMIFVVPGIDQVEAQNVIKYSFE